MEDISPLVTVVIAVLSSSVFATFIANKATYKGISVQAITEERIQWLDELREIASKFATVLAKINRLDENEEMIESADRAYAQLQLHLNPRGSKEEKILEYAKAMLDALGSEDFRSTYRTIEADFMLSVRDLLKQEWDKAKTEAGVAKSNMFPQPEFGLFGGAIGISALFVISKELGAF